MKKLMPILLLLFSAAAFAQAPPPPPQNGTPPPPKEKKTPEQRATDQSNHLEKDLGLSPDQKSKVYSLVLSREQKMEKLRGQQNKDTAAVRAEKKKIRDEFDAGMKTTLSPEQYQKWETMKKQHPRPEGPPPSPEQRACNFADHLEHSLGLNADQKKKVHDLALTKEQEMSGLRSQQPHDEAWHNKAKEVHRKFNDGMKATLTPEQYKKWQEQKKERREKMKARKQSAAPSDKK